MRLVIDTNQADSIRLSYKVLPVKSRPTLVIPHFVWLELLFGSGAEARRRALEKFPLEFGMDMAAIFDQLAKRSEESIRSFVPVWNKRSLIYRELRESFLHPNLRQLRRAEEQREEGVKYRKRLINVLPELKKKHKKQANDAKSRGESWETVEWADIEDATYYLFEKPDAPYRLWLIKEVSTGADGKHRPIAAGSGDSMFDAAWDNPMLRRFLRLQAIVCLGYCDAWLNPNLNRYVKENCDDLPDTSLVLYARDGDSVLTEDSISDRIRAADVEKSIIVSTWEQWLARSRSARGAT